MIHIKKVLTPFKIHTTIRVMKDIKFGKMMKEYRLKTGLSREKFGSKIGISPFTLRDWEKEKSEPHSLVKGDALRRARLLADAMKPFPYIKENGPGSDGIDKLLGDNEESTEMVDYQIVVDVIGRKVQGHMQRTILKEIRDRMGWE